MTIDATDARQLHDARECLAQIPTGSHLGLVVEALRLAVPIATGFIDTFVDSRPEAAVMSPANMPQDLIDEIMLTRDQDCRPVFGLIRAAPPGTLILDHETAHVVDWTEIAGYHALRRWGLSRPSGMLLRSSPRGTDCEHTYLALLRASRDRRWSERERSIVQALSCDITAAVQRARLPLLAREAILGQIVREQGMGMVLCTPLGVVRECNHLAHVYAHRYARFAGIVGQRTALSDLVMKAIDPRRPESDPWAIQDPEGRIVSDLEVSAHRLAVQEHALREPLVLVLMKARDATARPGSGIPSLPPRLMQVARLLIQTGLSYKQIGDRMGVREGTVRKHVERLYRMVGVHSRAELSQRLRRSQRDGD